MDFGFFVIAFMFSGLACCVWVLWCNTKTCDQRIDLLHGLLGRSNDDFNRLIVALNEVSYDNHMWYLITFRDPYSLYPSDIARK